MFRYACFFCSSVLFSACTSIAPVHERGVTLSSMGPATHIAFEQVSANIIATARRVCIEQRSTVGLSSCDFRVIRLAGADMPANAFQTEDQSGRPVIIVTDVFVQSLLHEDELAFVLAHEAAHHIAAHRLRLLKVKTAALAEELALAPLARERISPLQFEREADALGVTIAQAAGYDPRNAVSLFERLPLENQTGTNMVGHPSPKERRATLIGQQDH